MDSGDNFKLIDRALSSIWCYGEKRVLLHIYIVHVYVGNLAVTQPSVIHMRVGIELSEVFVFDWPMPALLPVVAPGFCHIQPRGSDCFNSPPYLYNVYNRGGPASIRNQLSLQVGYPQVKINRRDCTPQFWKKKLNEMVFKEIVVIYKYITIYMYTHISWGQFIREKGLLFLANDYLYKNQTLV